MPEPVVTTGPSGGEHRETRLTQLIISVFGLYARDEGNWLATATIVELLADLGIDHQAVRSAISRLKRRGVLLAQRHGTAAGYLPAPTTLDILAEGDVRIFEHRRATLNDKWVLAVFSVPETERSKRHTLRAALARLGFGTAAPGVWIAPGTLRDEAQHTIDRLGLAAYVNIFIGEYATTKDLRTEIRTWWDLDELSTLYADFIHAFQPDPSEPVAESLTRREAFQAYVPMLTHWRRLPYRDPGLPLDLLPERWNGEQAHALFEDMDARLRPLAAQHVGDVLHTRLR